MQVCLQHKAISYKLVPQVGPKPLVVGTIAEPKLYHWMFRTSQGSLCGNSCRLVCVWGGGGEGGGVSDHPMRSLAWALGGMEGLAGTGEWH